MAIKERYYVEQGQKYKIVGYITKDEEKYVIVKLEDEDNEFETHIMFLGIENSLSYKLKDEDFGSYQIIIPLYQAEHGKLYYIEDEDLLEDLFEIFEGFPSYYP